MYRFVDQPLDSQAEGPQFLIWVMRQWVAAAMEGRCACHRLQAAFTSMGVERAVDDFHLAMRTLCNNARIPLRFGAVDRLEITEHEAVLLAAAGCGEAGVNAVSRQLVHADMAALFTRSFVGIVRAFTGAGLSIQVSANGPASR